METIKTISKYPVKLIYR